MRALRIGCSTPNISQKIASQRYCKWLVFTHIAEYEPAGDYVMFTRALLTTVCVLAASQLANAQYARTFTTENTGIRSLHYGDNTGPMRTLLTRENKFPELGHAEIGGYVAHDELDDSDQNSDRDSLGVYGRYSFWENVTFEAGVPVVSSDFSGDDEIGIGDIDLKLDLIAFQDIFRYPFIIPHIEVTLPTGDEDDGLGTGEAVTTLGISVGTKVYDQLTYVADISYAFNGAKTEGDDDENTTMGSLSIVWDITDRFALITEGRIYEENNFGNMPYQYEGGMAYRFTRDVQLAGYAGRYHDETEDEKELDMATVRLAVQF